MKCVHYWHFANQWYCYLNDNPNHSRIPSGDKNDIDAYKWKEKYLIVDSVGLTHRQVKEKLV